MKILIISIRFGPPFQRDLIEALTRQGHEVTFFSAGRVDLTMRPHLRWSSTAGVRQVDLINSPNVPGTTGDPDLQTSHPIVEALTGQVLDQVQPDVVHVHELSGHCLSILGIIQARGIPSIVSFHNFWPICPQLTLVDASGAACEDYAEGEKCTRCHWSPTVADRFGVEQVRSILIDTPIFKPVRWLRSFIRRLVPRNNRNSLQAPGWSDPLYTGPVFVRRRLEAVRLLNQANVIHAMSSRSAAVLHSYGIRSERIKVLPISLYNLDRLQKNNHYDMHQPFVFGYCGNLAYIKGVHLLIKAFAQLDQTKGRLLIYGSGEPDYMAQLRRLAVGLNVSFMGEYNANDLSKIHSQIDVGVVPSIWDETFCLVGMEFLKSGIPVIASRMGGMLDYVDDRVNGLLVNPRDINSLREAMVLCISSPALLTQMRSQIHQNYPSMDQVSSSFLQLYTDTMKGV